MEKTFGDSVAKLKQQLDGTANNSTTSTPQQTPKK